MIQISKMHRKRWVHLKVSVIDDLNVEVVFGALDRLDLKSISVLTKTIAPYFTIIEP